MKLYYTTTSPFARKVLVTAQELGVPLHAGGQPGSDGAAGIETVFLRPSPTKPDPELSRSNPLSKIPALVLDDGTTLYDSPVICEYLDATFGPRLLPPSGPARWRVLRCQALADGMLDAGVLVFYEKTQRPPELHWPSWIAGQTAKVMQALDALEAEVDAFTDELDLGQIAAAAALGWLEFRKPVGELRGGHHRLFAWYDAVRRRPSLQATEPS